jgi:tetratricopeptide (TPR) repeat protein
MHPALSHSGYQDPELSVVVQRIVAELATLPSKYGEPDAYSVDTGTFDEHALYRKAVRMCDDEEFAKALPIALHLTAASNGRSAYTFMAASCLQRLGYLEPALALFTACVLAREDDPAALFRAGECLNGLGRRDEALQMLDAAVEVSREDATYSGLQQLAQQMADALRH